MSKSEFLNSMRALLGSAFEEFESTLDAPAFRGILVNTLKCSPEKLQALLPFVLRPTPFSANGFYIEPDTKAVGTHPLHHAGAYYVQEPSAMAAATALSVQPGEKVLDLCAAPGGKTTALAGALQGEGLLWSNEYVKQRSFTLLSNCERIGVRNAVVSNSSTECLAKELPCFFDKVLVDAPCSGEGMLRREKAQYERWNRQNISICAERQKIILNDAAKMLKSGGEMVYSTCTFNRCENEDIAEDFLKNHPDFSLVSLTDAFGSGGFGLPDARRIFPKDGGEGHFIVKFKKGEALNNVKFKNFTFSPAPEAFFAFWQEQFRSPVFGTAGMIGNRVYLAPKELPQTAGISIIRAGVLAGEMKGTNFFPSHQLYTGARCEELKNVLNLPLTDTRVRRFLHGEEIDVGENDVHNGYCALAVEGIPLGFGKISGGKIKNHYPKGLRNLT